MRATIVRADEVKVGDRILSGSTIRTVEFTKENATATKFKWLWIQFVGGPGRDQNSDDLVCRIDPEPVVEQEFWRVKYEHYRDTPDGKGYYTRHTDASPTREIAIERYRRRYPDTWTTISFAKDATIEHVRETVLSREEIKND